MRLTALFLLGSIALQAQSPEVRLYGAAGSEANATPANSGSPLNPDNVLGINTWASTAYITLFGELVPQDKHWKLHFKLRENQQFGNGATARFDVNEFNFSYSVTPWLDLKIGRTIEKWGTGYAWNPTGVVNPAKNPEDPTDRNNAFRGVDMVGADLFIRNWNISLLGVPEINWNGRGPKTLAGAGWAARAYRVMRGTDVAITASGGNALPNSGGLSLARVFGNALELHGEAVYITDTLRYIPTAGSLAIARRPHAEILLGSQYTFGNGVNVIGEYFHSNNGLSASQWSAFRDVAQNSASSLNVGDPAPLLQANLAFSALTMGRDYSFVRVLWPIRPKKLELETIAITSLRDSSSIIRPSLTWHLRPDLAFYFIQTEFVGNATTELGHIQIRRESDLGIRYNFSFAENKH